MTYERLTAAPVSEVLDLAQRILEDRIPIERTGGDAHSVELSGGDGTVRIEAHRHGMDTTVTAITDQLRTSRLDNEVEYFLMLLPYQPGDRRSRGSAQPGGLTNVFEKPRS